MSDSLIILSFYYVQLLMSPISRRVLLFRARQELGPESLSDLRSSFNHILQLLESQVGGHSKAFSATIRAQERSLVFSGSSFGCRTCRQSGAFMRPNTSALRFQDLSSTDHIFIQPGNMQCCY